MSSRFFVVSFGKFRTGGHIRFSLSFPGCCISKLVSRSQGISSRRLSVSARGANIVRTLNDYCTYTSFTISLVRRSSPSLQSSSRYGGFRIKTCSTARDTLLSDSKSRSMSSEYMPFIYTGCCTPRTRWDGLGVHPIVSSGYNSEDTMMYIFARNCRAVCRFVWSLPDR